MSQAGKGRDFFPRWVAWRINIVGICGKEPCRDVAGLLTTVHPLVACEGTFHRFLDRSFNILHYPLTSRCCFIAEQLLEPHLLCTLVKGVL